MMTAQPLELVPQPDPDELQKLLGRAPRANKAQFTPLDVQSGAPENAAMTEPLTRTEFHAELNAMRADIRASSSELRADFERMQRGVIESISQVAQATAELRGDLAGARGEVGGLKSSINMLQWVIGIVATVAGVWIAYMQLTQVPSQPVASQSQPIIIQVPQAAHAPAPSEASPAQPSSQ